MKPDLSTRYLGLKLRSPLVASPSPLCESLDNVKRMEDAGAGAVVLHSLFEEQIALDSRDLDRFLSKGTESTYESLSFFPDMESYNLGPEGYLDYIRRCKEAVRLPVIASLNGFSSGGWSHYARWMEEAGADALELNIYYIPTEPLKTGREVEEMYVELVRDVVGEVGIPVAVKLSPFFSSLPNLARRLDGAGAKGLVLFNRFYQPNFDLDKLEVVPDLDLSSPCEIRLRLRWAAILFGRVRADLALTGGVHSGRDALKCMMAGARVAMTASALLKFGIGHLEEILREMREWMEENEYDSVRKMQGSMSRKSAGDPAEFERANYMKVLRSYALKPTVSPD